MVGNNGPTYGQTDVRYRIAMRLLGKTEIGESEYSYTYEYRKPDIVLTPEESGREKLTGRIEPFDSHGLVLKLFLPAGEEYLRVYSGEYFK